MDCLIKHGMDQSCMFPQKKFWCNLYLASEAHIDPFLEESVNLFEVNYNSLFKTM